jgi:integrase/recombinase XerD
LEKGTNLKTIQLLLGHANIKTTSIYMHVAKNIITEIKSPLDDLEIDIK